MKQWPLVLLIVFIQESVTLNGLLVKTYQGRYSIVFMTLLFVLATCIDILVGFWLGKYAKHRWNKGKVRVFARKWAGRFYTYVGKRGSKVYLLLLGYFSFPYLNAFIASWLDIPFMESFWYFFFGDLILYATSWLLVLGVTSIVPSPFLAFVVVIIITIVIIFITRLFKVRKI